MTENLKLKTENSFSFRTYQREDLARSAIHDGAIIAWDPGLGKTMAVFAWPVLKGARNALIVAPASLHEQLRTEGREKFKVEVIPIHDQEAAYDLMRRGILPRNFGLLDLSLPSSVFSMPRFFVTDYRWLGYNGGDEWPDSLARDKDDDEAKGVGDLVRRRRMAIIARHFGIANDFALATAERAAARSNRSVPAHELLGVPADAPRSAVKAAYRNQAKLTHPDLHPGDPTATARMQRLNDALTKMLGGDATAIVKGLDDEVAEARPTIEAIQSGIGRVKDGIRCVFAPTLSTILADCFDCIVCDEAVRLKTGTTYIAMGVLNMRANFRLALTGTPIKNRLPDIFFLATWACGVGEDPVARWPYGNTPAHKSAFSNNHLVMEENLTKNAESRAKGVFRRFIKQTNNITNVHRLWKLLGPVVIRRRKDQIGDDIVGKVMHPIRVQPGTEQQKVYKWHLDNPPPCATPVASLGAQLQNLRQAALCHWSPSIYRNGFPASKGSIRWSPKLVATLHLAADLMERGEQLVVFSPFREFSTALHAACQDAGVDSLLVGRAGEEHAARRTGRRLQGPPPSGAHRRHRLDGRGAFLRVRQPPRPAVALVGLRLQPPIHRTRPPPRLQEGRDHLPADHAKHHRRTPRRHLPGKGRRLRPCPRRPPLRGRQGGSFPGRPDPQRHPRLRPAGRHPARDEPCQGMGRHPAPPAAPCCGRLPPGSSAQARHGHASGGTRTQAARGGIPATRHRLALRPAGTAGQGTDATRETGLARRHRTGQHRRVSRTARHPTARCRIRPRHPEFRIRLSHNS